MFDTFSQAQMIFLSLIMFSTLFGAIRLMSLVGIATWVFAAISLVGVMAFDLDMIYFWFMLILAFISLAVGSSVKVFYGSKV